MQRKSFEEMPCPVARSLERVGEWWSMLILRDALHGFTRFDQFQKSLGIAPNMLTRRLSALVDAGLLARRRYSDHPPRDEYVLTDCGRDFRPVIVALLGITSTLALSVAAVDLDAAEAAGGELVHVQDDDMAAAVTAEVARHVRGGPDVPGGVV